MTDYCDLGVLLLQSNKSLKNVGLFCKVLREIRKPTAFDRVSSFQDNGKFVEASIFAVNLGAHKTQLASLGLVGESPNFLANGTVSLYVDMKLPLNDWYYFEGTLALSVQNSGIALATLSLFKKVSNNWQLDIIKAKDFEVNLFKGTSRQFALLEKSVTSGVIVQPQDVQNTVRLYAEIPYVPEVSIPNSLPCATGVESGYTSFHSDSSSDFGGGLCSSMLGSIKVPESKSRRRTKKESRKDIKPMPPIFDELSDTLMIAKKVQNKYLKNLSKDYGIGERDYVEKLLNQIRNNWRSKPSTYASTGKALLKKYIVDSGEDVEQDYMGTKLIDYMLSIYNQLFDFCLYGETVDADGEALDIIKILFSDGEIVYAGIVSQFLDITMEKATSLARNLMQYGISFSYILQTNPYIFTICGFDLNFKSTESIAYVMGIWNSKDIDSSRNVAILADYMVYGETQDTNYTYKDIMKSDMGIKLTSSSLNKLKANESILALSTKSNSIAYLRVYEVPYSKTGWVYSDGYYLQKLSTNLIAKAIKDAEDVGMLTRKTLKGTDYLLCTKFLQMELMIVQVCYNLANKPSRYTDLDRINNLIRQYEIIIGFDLEPEQRDGVITVVTNRVGAISGPAGSGKTTTSDCIVYVLKHYDCDNEPIIRYAAPTGKAAKRLQEIVGGVVSTMHSMFRVGIGARTLIDDIYAFEEEDSNDLSDNYVFDEVAMVDLNLMYNVMSKTGSSSITFLGDICQLPPIGKGLPFRDLLRFIPCVYLRVSKRSLEGSGISLNSDLINENSDRENFKPLVSTDDFKLVECPDDDISNKVITICSYHLGKITKAKFETAMGIEPIPESVMPNLQPEDIQVIVPVSRSSYSWGAETLNIRLQALFNPASRERKEIKVNNFGTEKIFRVGDKVIHLANMYSVQWYADIDENDFTMDWGQGIMNGDVGKIVDIVEATKDCKFHKPETAKPSDYKEPKYKARKDKSWRGKDKYFIVVEYYDFNKSCPYYILYQALRDSYVNKPNTLFLTGMDLKNLSLAYALTTHKMQGSQSSLTVYALGKVKRQGFVTRNAIYTGITRAQNGDYLVGSVGSGNSQLNVARLLVAHEGVNTLLGDIWDMEE